MLAHVLQASEGGDSQYLPTLREYLGSHVPLFINVENVSHDVEKLDAQVVALSLAADGSEKQLTPKLSRNGR